MGVWNCRFLTNDLVSKDGRMFSITNEVAGGILLSTFLHKLYLKINNLVNQ